MCFLSFIQLQASERIVLVKNGIPESTIILARHPTRSAQFAAFDLQHYVKRITGTIIPIVKYGEPESGIKIFVGESKGTKGLGINAHNFEDQQYEIKFTGDTIAIVGRDAADFGIVKYDMKSPGSCSTWPQDYSEHSTVYAEDDFLMDFCGVRWFNPSDTGTYFPRNKTLTVNGHNVLRKPFFKMRESLASGLDNYNEEWSLWGGSKSSSKIKDFNRWEQAAYYKEYKEFSHPWMYLQAIHMRLRLFMLHMKDGGKPESCNHSFYGYYDRFWEKNKNPDLAKFFVQKRPEYFAQGYAGRPPQLNYANKALVKQVTKDAVNYLEGKKTGAQLDIFWQPKLPNPFPLVAMDDSIYSRDPESQKWLNLDKNYHAGNYNIKGTASDYFYHFVNEVAKNVRKKISNPELITLAYANYSWPPKTFKLDKNVAVDFCFWDNRMPYDTVNYKNEINALKDWAVEKNPLYLWLYPTFPQETANNGNFYCFPGFYAHTLGRQFTLFKKFGVQGIFNCGYGQGVESYVTFRLMDNPSLNVNKLLSNYFTDLYGPAGKPLKQLYLAIEKTYSDPVNYSSIKHVNAQTEQIAWGVLGTAERMKKFSGLMKKAENLSVGATEREKHNVKLFDLDVWKYMEAGRAQYVIAMKAPIPTIFVPLLPDADGNPSKVSWNKSAELTGGWFKNGSSTPASRSLSGHIAYDGKYLYIELIDPCNTRNLVTSAIVFPFDDWEIYTAIQRSTPYRQFAVGPKGQKVILSHGGVNISYSGNDVHIISDVKQNKWIILMAIPLKHVVIGGIKKGGRFYLNIARVSSPKIEGSNNLGIDTWVPYTTVKTLYRLAEIKLEKT